MVLIKVLLIEDDPRQQALVARFLATEHFDVRATDSPMGATNLVRSFQPDVVLLDLDLPAYPGDKVIPLLRQRGLNPRILVYSASDEARLSAAGAAADGWMSKSAPLSLVATRLRQLATSPRRPSGHSSTG